MATAFDELEERAACELRKFTVEAGPNDVKIPHRLLSRARGIGIHWGWKAGALVSVESEKGLVIVRLPNGKWSCPVPVRKNEGGIGLTLGAEKKSFITVICSTKGINNVKCLFAGNPATELSLAAGPSGAIMGNADESTVGDDNMPIYVYTSDPEGMMISADVGASWYHPMKDQIKERYGTHATEEAILAGTVWRVQWESSPLFRALNEVIPSFDSMGVATLEPTKEQGLHPARLRIHTPGERQATTGAM